MKALWFFLAFVGALVVLRFAFHLITVRAIFVGLVMFFVGYLVGHSSKDST